MNSEGVEVYNTVQHTFTSILELNPLSDSTKVVSKMGDS